MTGPLLCPTAQLLAATLSESPEAAFLLNSSGVVLYENPLAKRLLFETTDHHFDKTAGNPAHTYHFSFFWRFAANNKNTENKQWQDIFDDLVRQDETDLTRQNSNDTDLNSSTIDHRRFGVNDHGLHEEYQVTCQRTNGTEFPASLRLSKIGACPCCQNAGSDHDESQNDGNVNRNNTGGEVYLCAYVKANSDEFQNPFAKEGTSLKCILNASFDPVFSIDEEGTILMVNEAAVRAFGWTSAEFVGSNISMICGGGHAAQHDQYLRNYLETGVKKIIDKKREVPARRKDGSEFPIELGVKEVSCLEYGVQGGESKRIFCAFLKDLSAEKAHQEETKQSIDLLQGMINCSFDPMFQIDQKGTIQAINTAAVALFGYRREELIGHNISIICGKEHAANHDSYLKHYLETGQKRVIGRKRQVVARRKDGKEFDIELGVQEVIARSGEKMFCGFVRDLTRQNLEKRRMRKQDQVMRGNFFGEQNHQKDGKNFGHQTTM